MLNGFQFLLKAVFFRLIKKSVRLPVFQIPENDQQGNHHQNRKQQQKMICKWNRDIFNGENPH